MHKAYLSRFLSAAEMVLTVGNCFVGSAAAVEFLSVFLVQPWSRDSETLGQRVVIVDSKSLICYCRC